MIDESIFGKGATDVAADYLRPEAPQHIEISGAFQPAVWVEKKPEDFITYPKRNQNGQSTCSMYTLAKLLAIDELSENGQWRELSPRSVYPYVVIPGGGSNSLEGARLSCKQGMTLEFLLPTDGLTEDQVQKADGYNKDAKQVAFVYAPQSVMECTVDFETIASILQGFAQQGIKKGVGVTVIGSNNGTWLSLYPKPPIPGSVLWYHKVTVTDFGLINGKKYLSIDNSWGTTPGRAGQQFLGEEYQPSMYGGIYTLNQPDDWQTYGISHAEKPSHQWSVTLAVGSSGPDVTALQQALQSLGMFPVSSVVKPTGAFYGVTRQSLMTFQASFGIPVTGIVDEVTRIMLNGIFK